MKLLVTYPDPEPLVVAYLRDGLADLGLPWTVDKIVPATFNPADPDQQTHIEVALDGTPTASPPVTAGCTVRLVAWCPTGYQSRAIRAALVAQGILLAHPGGGGVAATTFLTGALPTQDPESRAEIAATTTRVTIRSQPLEPSGS